MANYISKHIDEDILSRLNVDQVGDVVSAETWCKLWELTFGTLREFDKSFIDVYNQIAILNHDVYINTIDIKNLQKNYSELNFKVEILQTTWEELQDKYELVADSYAAIQDIYAALDGQFIHYGSNPPGQDETEGDYTRAVYFDGDGTTTVFNLLNEFTNKAYDITKVYVDDRLLADYEYTTEVIDPETGNTIITFKTAPATGVQNIKVIYDVSEYVKLWIAPTDYTPVFASERYVDDAIKDVYKSMLVDSIASETEQDTLKTITLKDAIKYGTPGVLTPWFSNELKKEDIAKLVVGGTVLIHVLVDGRDAYIQGIVRAKTESNCSIDGVALHYGNAAIDWYAEATESGYIRNRTHYTTPKANGTLTALAADFTDIPAGCTATIDNLYGNPINMNSIYQMRLLYNYTGVSWDALDYTVQELKKDSILFTKQDDGLIILLEYISSPPYNKIKITCNKSVAELTAKVYKWYGFLLALQREDGAVVGCAKYEPEFHPLDKNFLPDGYKKSNTEVVQEANTYTDNIVNALVIPATTDMTQPVGKNAEGKLVTAQSDWNATDTEEGYIKNRTHFRTPSIQDVHLSTAKSSFEYIPDNDVSIKKMCDGTNTLNVGSTYNLVLKSKVGSTTVSGIWQEIETINGVTSYLVDFILSDGSEIDLVYHLNPITYDFDANIGFYMIYWGDISTTDILFIRVTTADGKQVVSYPWEYTTLNKNYLPKGYEKSNAEIIAEANAYTNSKAPDWNANENEAGYIKNRTHNIIKETPVNLVFDSSAYKVGGKGGFYFEIECENPLVLNETYQLKVSSFFADTEILTGKCQVFQNTGYLVSLSQYQSKYNMYLTYGVSPLTFRADADYALCLITSYNMAEDPDILADFIVKKDNSPVQITPIKYKKLSKKYLPVGYEKSNAEVIQDANAYTNSKSADTEKYVNNTFAPVIKNTISKVTVAKIDDVAEYENNIKINSLATSYNKYYIGGRNILPYPYVDTTVTRNGITFTDNGDGTITANGTATDSASFRLCTTIDLYGGNEPAVLSGCPAWVTPEGCIIKNPAAGDETGAGLLMSTSNMIAIIIINAGVTVNNLKFYPQIELGTELHSYMAEQIYEPYKMTVYQKSDFDENNNLYVPKITPIMSVVSDGAYMDISYKIDTQAYVDKKIAEAIAKHNL